MSGAAHNRAGDCDPQDARSVSLAHRAIAAVVGEPTAVALGQIVSLLRSIVEAIFDASIAENPDAYAFVGSSPITKTFVAGQPELAYKNDTEFPVMVRVQGPTDKSSALPSYLFLAAKASNATQTKATVIVYKTAPKAAIILPPNRSCYVDGTDPAGGTSMSVTISVVQLQGRSTLFTRGN
jgi:hypothetical protein